MNGTGSPQPVDTPPPGSLTVRAWCFDCGATGLTSTGDTCPLCEGLGQC